MNLAAADIQRITILHSPLAAHQKLLLMALVQTGIDPDYEMLAAMTSQSDDALETTIDQLQDNDVLELNESLGTFRINLNKLEAMPQQPAIAFLSTDNNQTCKVTLGDRRGSS